MQKELQLQLSPELASQDDAIKRAVSQKSGVPFNDINYVEIVKRSIDARKKEIKINLSVKAFVHEMYRETKINLPNYPNVEQQEPIVIIGAGPAGLFAALKCIELGKKPIIIERGKDVKERRRDLKAINIGESWNKKIEDEASPYTFDATYTLTKVENGKVYIDLDSKVGMKDAIAVEDEDLDTEMTGKQTGTFIYDQKSMWLIEAILNQDFDMVVEQMGMSMPMKLKGDIIMVME